MDIPVSMEFVAHTASSLLILAGVLGWLLCGFTKIEVFCNWWGWFVAVGALLYLLKHLIDLL